MQILASKSPQLSEGGHDVGFDVLEAAKNPNALFLTELVELTTQDQLLQVLRERPTIDCRLEHAESPQGDHLTDEPRLCNTRNRHSQDVTLLRL